MILRNYLRLVVLTLTVLFAGTSYGQCFEIESILVDACSPTNPTNEEGLNEMVRFKVGPNPLNTANLTVTWPNNAWGGIIQNATTANVVAQLNASIATAGNCGQILQPTGGVLPANATVLLVTSQNVNVTFNSFATLTTTVYMIFQNNTTNIGGHFANYNTIPGTRTLVMSFGGTCTDTVTYERSLLINNTGGYGGPLTSQDGAAVNFTPAGVPTYVNNGCLAPVQPFTVNAGNTQTACRGASINLTGTAQGQQSVQWTAPGGTFTNPTSLNTSYTLPTTGSSVTLTLTATNICGLAINSTVTINFSTVADPTVTTPVNYCQNAVATPLVATPSAGGTLNWYGTNATGGTASAVPPTPSTATLGTFTYYVSQTIAGCESNRVPIVVNIANTGPSLNLFCDLASPNTTPTSINFDFSNVGQTNFTYTYTVAGGSPVTGTWVAPSNYTVTGLSPGTSVTFTLQANGVACVSPMTVTCNTPCATFTTPNFPTISPICQGSAVPTLATTSPNGISGTWSPATINPNTSGSYTFTPDSVLFPCANPQTLNVTITPQVTPTFSAIGPLCAGTSFTLPTTSNNGIQGTWSPAPNLFATTTYTFTPINSACATSTTLTVAINSTGTPTFNLTNQTFCEDFVVTQPILPATSNNGITGTWSPGSIQTGTTGVTNYVFTPTTGQCANTFSFTITVVPNVTPTFTPVAAVCSGTALTALPTTSNNGITGTWSPALNNTATTTYTFTPNANQCATTTTLQIVITPKTTPTFAAITPLCAGTTTNPLPSTSTNGISGTWSPAFNNAVTTTYTFTPNAGQCANTATLSVPITAPVTPTFTAIAPICINTPFPTLPTTSTNGITGTWSPAPNNMASTTYTFTPATGQCATTTTLTVNVINNSIVPNFSISATRCPGLPSPLPTTSSNGITGTWSPAYTPNASNTYTFTPNAGQCATTVTQSITIVAAPAISNPTPYVVCDDNNDGVACTFDLSIKIPEITTNPAVQVTFHVTTTDAQTGSNPIPVNVPFCNNDYDQQTIYIRVFDPAAPNCPSYTTLLLIVNKKPVATPPSDYHKCDDNTDGIAVFNLNTVVNPQVLGSLSASQHTVTYYASQADALVPQNALSGTNTFSSASTTLWIRVQNNTTGCFDVVSVDLVVDPLPLLPAVGYFPQYELCETTAPVGFEIFNLNSQLPTILNGQTGIQVKFYPSLANANANTNAITNPGAYQNGVAYNQTLGIRLTNTTTGCFVITTMDLVVNPKPSILVPTAPYTVCDDNQDGVGQFDLSTLTPQLLAGAPTLYNITYHVTQIDAQTPLNPINVLVPFVNNDPYTQVIWVRAEDPTTGCVTIAPITLQVNIAPIEPFNLPTINNCDVDSNPTDGCTTFNLALQTPAVLAQQTTAANNYTVTYYTSQADASASPVGINPIVNTTNYTACGTTTIWVRVENKSSHCFAVGSFDLQVNLATPVSLPTLYALCDDDATPNNQFTSFDLVSFIGPTPGLTLQFYLNAAHTQPINNPSAFTNTIAANQTLFLVLTNATGCKSYSTLTVKVLPIPTPNTNPPALAPKCDDTNPGDGLEIFDLTVNAAYILNGQANVSLHYYPSYNDAVANTNEILSPTTANVGANVWIRVESNLNIDSFNEHCYVLVEQALTVNPLPTLVQPVADYQECDDDTDNITAFNLTAWGAANLLTGNALPLSNYTLSFYEDAAHTLLIANPTSYLNTSNPQQLWVIATNTTTGCRSVVGSFNILVNPKPLSTATANFYTCDTDLTNDGYFNVDFIQYETTILTGQSATDYTVTFYNTQLDAQNETNAITDLVNYMAYTHTIWIRVENNLTGCARLVSFVATVERLPEPVIETANNSHVICVDYVTDQVVRPLLLTA
ncbi:MAG: hypothetical protein RLZZ500_125, partial [Bacteroidota bacterium]